MIRFDRNEGRRSGMRVKVGIGGEGMKMRVSIPTAIVHGPGIEVGEVGGEGGGSREGLHGGTSLHLP